MMPQDQLVSILFANRHFQKDLDSGSGELLDV